MANSTAAYNAAVEKAYAESLDVEYAYWLWYLVASFIVVVAIFQLGSLFLSKLFPTRRYGTDTEQNGVVSTRSFSLTRVPLALVNAYRVVAFRCTFKIGSYSLNMAEVFVTIGYMAAVYALLFANTTSFSGEKVSYVYYRNRAALLAVTQLPLITALSTKNNIIGLITGISYEKLNYIHRMVSRVVITLVWIHGAATLKANPISEMATLREETGVTAAIALTLILVAGFRPVRAAAYEVFFAMHFVMVITFFACVYVHTKDTEHHNIYVWPCFIIWGLDRFIRFVRLVIFNHSYFGFRSGKVMDATVELLSPNLVRLRLQRPAHFHWKPGQSAFLTMPSVSTLPFESHPFTIVSVDRTRSESSEGDERDLRNTRPYWKELVFFIGVHGGFTKKLGQLAAKGGCVTAFVDGPYGHSPDLTTYDTSVLIAGGSGISFTLPLFLDSIMKASQGKSRTNQLVFMWIVRDPSQILWISETLTEALTLVPPTLSVSIRLFITTRNTSHVPQLEHSATFSSMSEESGKEKEKTPTASLLGDPAVFVTEGSRPDLKYLLQEEASMSLGRMSVSVCGSESLANSVRDALGFSTAGPSKILRGEASITLHVEAFGYA